MIKPTLVEIDASLLVVNVWNGILWQLHLLNELEKAYKEKKDYPTERSNKTREDLYSAKELAEKFEKDRDVNSIKEAMRLSKEATDFLQENIEYMDILECLDSGKGFGTQT